MENKKGNVHVRPKFFVMDFHPAGARALCAGPLR